MNALAHTSGSARTNLRPLAARTWAMYRAALSHPAVVRPAMPILYFGDHPAYLRSPLKVITVGLNPSHAEFPSGKPFQRFPAAAILAERWALQANNYDRYLDALDEYFRVSPYGRWFNPSFEPILEGLGASYYDGPAIRALHTDVCSPVPTDPTWSRLGNAQGRIGDRGFRLWTDLVAVLEPDVIIVSVAKRHVTGLSPVAVDEWPVAFTVDRTNPYYVRAIRATPGRLIVFGQAAHTPFGTISGTDKLRLGQAIGRLLNE